MPPKLQTGAYVSSKKSACAPWLPVVQLEGGQVAKKTRQRIYGVVLTSASGSKWKVRWDDGQTEDIPKVCLKFEGPPDSDSERMVNMAMAGNR